VHEDIRSLYAGFPSDAHPMAILLSIVNALSTFYQDALDPRNPRHVELAIHRLIAKMPTIAAYSYKKSIGQPFVYPTNELSYCANFLKMMFAVPCEPYVADEDFIQALNMLLIVHADHEQNCSTSTVRIVGSSEANIFASMAAGIAPCGARCTAGERGGRHDAGTDPGGRRQRREVRPDGQGQIPPLPADGLRPSRLQTLRSARVNHQVGLRQAAGQAPHQRSVVRCGPTPEEVALNDPYFIERKLYPNVDFYSGVIYRAMGLPVQMFTVLFALGRCPAGSPIGSRCRTRRAPYRAPRQIYTGPTKRDFVPLNKRS